MSRFEQGGARPGIASPSSILLPALLLVFTVLAAACGSGSTDVESGAGEPDPTPASPASSPASSESSPTSPPSEDPGETFDQALAEFSQCVRDRGYAVKELTLEAVVGALLSGGPGSDPRGIDGAVDPILASALGLDPDDPDVLAAVDGCADDVQPALSELELS